MPNTNVNCSKKEQDKRVEQAKKKAEQDYRRTHGTAFVLFKPLAWLEMKNRGGEAADHQRDTERHRCKRK